MRFEDRYDKKWTELSFRELVNFARWMNKIIGYHPTVIGGWAVYLYHKGLGSRDIDVVLPRRNIKDKVINMYLGNNGYEIRTKTFGEDEWIKYLEPGNTASEIYLDVCTFEDNNLVHGADIEIPWAIVNDGEKDIKVDNADLHIPAPEVLLILKVKAAWDRAYDISQGSSSDFLRDKLRKDRIDVISILLNCELNTKSISKNVRKYRFEKYFIDAISRVSGDDFALQHHGIRGEKRKKLIQIVDKIVSGM